MREYITGDSIANQVRMTRSAFAGAFLILEGETDVLVFQSFIDERECQTVFADGKQNALAAIGILDDDNLKGVLCVVDADFDHLENRVPLSDNVLLTDLHDLECMMLVSPAFDKLLREYASGDRKVAQFQSRNPDTENRLCPSEQCHAPRISPVALPKRRPGLRF